MVTIDERMDKMFMKPVYEKLTALVPSDPSETYDLISDYAISFRPSWMWETKEKKQQSKKRILNKSKNGMDNLILIMKWHEN